MKLGIIVEGDSEKIIFEGSGLLTYLSELQIGYIPSIRNAEGNGNLLPLNLSNHTQILRDQGATVILIVTDLDDEQCITNTKVRIGAPEDHIICLSIKMLEAWYLADTLAIRNYLNSPDFYFEFPETVNPFEEINSIRSQINGRGAGNKKILARQMLKSGFSIINAAKHPNCNSAKYFIRQLQNLTTE